MPLRPERWSDLWREYSQAAGIEVLPLHSARHSAVTSLRRAGVSDWVVAAFAGHDEGTMRRVYSHHDDDDLVAASEALAKVRGDVADRL